VSSVDVGFNGALMNELLSRKIAELKQKLADLRGFL
jgi:hypothetical protein